MDLISIIVPVYKVENYIHRCIDSIINQTYTNLEIILVDDGSPDNCGKICDEYAEKDSRIKVIHKTNGGLSDARNHGIDAATGEWLMFIDSDDWIHEKTVETLYNAAIEKNVAISVCSYTQTSKENPEVDISVSSELWSPKDFYIKNHIVATVAWGKLYRKKCFETIRYPKGKIHEDEYVTYRILFAEDKIAFVDQPYYAYFINQEGITKTQWSPKRLDAIEAILDQVNFFKGLQDENLIDHSLRVAFVFLFQQKKLCNRNIYKKEYRFIKRKMSMFLFLNRKYLFDIKHAYMFETVYPRFMKYYWLARAALRKVMRRK